MNIDIIKKAEAGQYSAFSKMVDAEMLNKLSNHVVVDNYTNEISKIADAKAKFVDIQNCVREH